MYFSSISYIVYAFPKVPFIYAFSKKLMHAFILKKNKKKSKKNHAFINVFSHKKDLFRHTLYMHS